MLRSLFSGVTGLINHQIAMDVIGNNIANVNTTGFKSGRVTFKELLAQNVRASRRATEERGGINPAQVGLGVKIGGVDTIFTQGNFQTTEQTYDMAIQGDGFFVVDNGISRLYTRAGTFDLDTNGTLIDPNNGYKVLGRMATDGEIDPITPVGEITIPFGSVSPAQETTEVVFSGNLNSEATPALASVWTASFALTTDPGTGSVPATGTTDLNDLDQTGISYDVLHDGDIIQISGTDPFGNSVAGTFTYNAATSNTVQHLLDEIETAFQAASGSATPVINASIDTSGNIVISDLATGDSSTTISLIFNETVPPQSDISLPSFTNTVVGAEAATVVTSIDVFDSLGTVIPLSVTFTKTENLNEWVWQATVPSPASITSGGSGTIIFSPDGKLASFTGGNPLEINPNSGAANPLSITFRPGTSGTLEGLSGFSASSTAVARSQDGFSMGTLTETAIDDTGTITGIFTNGQAETLAQLIMANFANAGGLTKEGSTYYQQTANSGQPVLGTAGVGGLGTINSGILEMSNVDLAKEFTNMIIIQRGFQSNSRIITTSDEMLQELLTLKR